MRKLTIIVAVIVLCASTWAQAATSTGNMLVSAIVTSTCSVQSAALMLGNNNTIRQHPQVGVNCSAGTAYTASWDNSNGAATLNNTGNGNQQSLPLSGVVPTSQNISTGNFNDVVAITLSY
jgi:spore coat protein U-like protein